MKTLTALVVFFLSATSLLAADFTGIWVRRDMPGMTMTIHSWGASGGRITYDIQMGGKVSVMAIESALDGTDATVIVDGKPTPQTMAIKRLDDRHTFTVLKNGGKPAGTSKCEMSADGKTLTVENEIPATAAGGTPMKSTETWNRK
jgi:hypothetical protein